MKKGLTLILSLMFMIIPTIVLAEGQCTCFYGNDAVGITISVSDTGTPSVQKSGSASGYIVLSTNNLSVTNFKDTTSKKWKCPSALYYDITSSGRSATYSNITTVKPSKVVGVINLDSSKSSDGELYESSSTNTEGNNSTLNCVYGALTLTIDNGQQIINGSNAGCSHVNLPNYSELSDTTTCPKKIYAFKYAVPSTNGYTCSYAWKSSTGYSEVTLNGNEPVFDANGQDVADKTSTTSSAGKNEGTAKYDTKCPLGEDVTKDLYGLLKIVKIAAPLLVIALTIFEGVISLTKGDIQADMKKLYTRLIKRVIYAVILFFLPVLVNQIMIMANVWDSEGTCDFSNSVEYNKTPATIIDANTKISLCTKKCPASKGAMNQKYCIEACESCMKGCESSFANDSDSYTSCISNCGN